MQNIFFPLLKPNKILFFVLFFLVVSGIILPRVTIAICQTGSDWGDDSCKNSMIRTLELPFETVDANSQISYNWSLFQAITIALGKFVVNGAGQLAALSMMVLSYFIAKLNNTLITTNEYFVPAWASMRDIANMFIVLAFVVIGIATTLRLREYEAKKLLLPLILIAIFINFSNVFVGLIIDASNIMVSGIGGNSAGLMPYTVILKLQRASSNYLNPALSLDSGKFLGSCILFAFVYLGIALTFLYSAIILLARTVVLLLLFILSPIAFVCWVFPASKKLWSEWWNNFLKWCFVGVFASLVLSLTVTIMNTQDALKNSATADLGSLFISCTIVLVFLYIGLKMTAKSSGLASMATGAVMGLATGAAGLAMGVAGKAGMGTLKGLAGATNLDRAGNAIKNRATQLGERIGLVSRGTAASAEAKRLDEPKKRLNALNSQQLAGIAQQSAWTKQRSEDKAAAATILAERKDLNLIPDINTRAAVVAHATSFPGVKPSDFEKADYHYAGLNNQRVRQVMNTQHIPEADARQKVVEAQLEANLPSMDHGQLRNIDHGHLTPNLVNRRFTPDKVAAFRTGSQDQIDQLQNPVRTHLDGLRIAAGPANPAIPADPTTNPIRDQREFDRLNKLITEIDNLL